MAKLEIDIHKAIGPPLRLLYASIVAESLPERLAAIMMTEPAAAHGSAGGCRMLSQGGPHSHPNVFAMARKRGTGGGGASGAQACPA
jgi:hypothetical protein